MRGRRSSFERAEPRNSVTIRWAMPVASSTCSVSVLPSTMSWNFTTPPFSVMTGIMNGSHSAMRSPLVTIWPWSAIRWAP
jgi:hypothetical protein